MRISDLLRLAWDNLRRNRTRSVLTGVGVMVGVAALLALLSYGSGLQKNAQREFDALELYNTLRVTSNRIPMMTGGGAGMAMAIADSVRKPGEQVPLTDSLVQRMEAMEGVLAAYPEVNFPAKLRGDRKEIVVNAEAVPMAFQTIASYQPMAGRFFESADEAAALISPSMAERLGYDPVDSVLGDTLKLVTASLNLQKIKSVPQLFAGGLRALPMGQRPYRVKVTGLLSEDQQPVSGLTRVIIPLEFGRELDKVTFFSTLDMLFRNAETQDGYSAVRVQVHSADALPSVRRSIEEMGVYVTSFREQFDRLEQLFLIMDLALAIIGIIALLVATIGIANTVMMNVRERYNEIGVMMAVGGEQRDLQTLFVVESGMLGLLGGLAGLVFGWAVVLGLDWGVNLYLDRLGVPPLTVFDTTWGMAGGIWAVALVISLLAGFFPARRAARIEPVEALRSV